MIRKKEVGVEIGAKIRVTPLGDLAIKGIIILKIKIEIKEVVLRLIIDGVAM